MSRMLLVVVVAVALGMGMGLAVGLAWGSRLVGPPTGSVEPPPVKVEKAAPAEAPPGAELKKADRPVHVVVDLPVGPAPVDIPVPLPVDPPVEPPPVDIPVPLPVDPLPVEPVPAKDAGEAGHLVGVYLTRAEADAVVKSLQARGVHADIVVDSSSFGPGETRYCVFAGKAPDGPITIRPSP